MDDHVPVQRLHWGDRQQYREILLTNKVFGSPVLVRKNHDKGALVDGDLYFVEARSWKKGRRGSTKHHSFKLTGRRSCHAGMEIWRENCTRKAGCDCKDENCLSLWISHMLETNNRYLCHYGIISIDTAKQRVRPVNSSRQMMNWNWNVSPTWTPSASRDSLPEDDRSVTSEEDFSKKRVKRQLSESSGRPPCPALIIRRPKPADCNRDWNISDFPIDPLPEREDDHYMGSEEDLSKKRIKRGSESPFRPPLCPPVFQSQYGQGDPTRFTRGNVGMDTCTISNSGEADNSYVMHATHRHLHHHPSTGQWSPVGQMCPVTVNLHVSLAPPYTQDMCALGPFPLESPPPPVMMQPPSGPDPIRPDPMMNMDEGVGVGVGVEAHPGMDSDYEDGGKYITFSGLLPEHLLPISDFTAASPTGVSSWPPDALQQTSQYSTEPDSPSSECSSSEYQHVNMAPKAPAAHPSSSCSDYATPPIPQCSSYSSDVTMNEYACPSAPQPLLPRRAATTIECVPTKGSMLGGYDVTVVGESFTNDLTFKFGNLTVERYRYHSPTVVFCVVPPCLGPTQVQVTVHCFHPKCDNGSTNHRATFLYLPEVANEAVSRVVAVLSSMGVGGAWYRPSGENHNGGPDLGGGGGGGGGSTGGGFAGGNTYHTRHSTVLNRLQSHVGRRAVFQPLITLLVQRALHIRDKGLLEAPNHTGHTLMHFMAVLDLPCCLALLLAAGVSLTSVDRNGYYPIHFAAIWARPRTVRLLAEASRGVVFARTASAVLPIALAVAARNLPSARALWRIGCAHLSALCPYRRLSIEPRTISLLVTATPQMISRVGCEGRRTKQSAAAAALRALSLSCVDPLSKTTQQAGSLVYIVNPAMDCDTWVRILRQILAELQPHDQVVLLLPLPSAPVSPLQRIARESTCPAMLLFRIDCAAVKRAVKENTCPIPLLHRPHCRSNVGIEGRGILANGHRSVLDYLLPVPSTAVRHHKNANNTKRPLTTPGAMHITEAELIGAPTAQLQDNATLVEVAEEEKKKMSEVCEACQFGCALGLSQCLVCKGLLPTLEWVQEQIGMQPQEDVLAVSKHKMPTIWPALRLTGHHRTPQIESIARAARAPTASQDLNLTGTCDSAGVVNPLRRVNDPNSSEVQEATSAKRTSMLDPKQLRVAVDATCTALVALKADNPSQFDRVIRSHTIFDGLCFPAGVKDEVELKVFRNMVKPLAKLLVAEPRFDIFRTQSFGTGQTRTSHQAAVDVFGTGSGVVRMLETTHQREFARESNINVAYGLWGFLILCLWTSLTTCLWILYCAQGRWAGFAVGVGAYLLSAIALVVLLRVAERRSPTVPLRTVVIGDSERLIHPAEHSTDYFRRLTDGAANPFIFKFLKLLPVLQFFELAVFARILSLQWRKPTDAHVMMNVVRTSTVLASWNLIFEQSPQLIIQFLMRFGVPCNDCHRADGIFTVGSRYAELLLVALSAGSLFLSAISFMIRWQHWKEHLGEGNFLPIFPPDDRSLPDELQTPQQPNDPSPSVGGTGYGPCSCCKTVFHNHDRLTLCPDCSGRTIMICAFCQRSYYTVSQCTLCPECRTNR